MCCGGILWPGTIPLPPPALPALRVVALGGEPMPRALAVAWLPRVAVLANTYGVTECCVYQAFHRVGGDGGGRDGGRGSNGERSLDGDCQLSVSHPTRGGGGGRNDGGGGGGAGLGDSVDVSNGCGGGGGNNVDGGGVCGDGGIGGISGLSLDSGCQLSASQPTNRGGGSCDGKGSGDVSAEGGSDDFVITAAALDARRGLGEPLDGCRLLLVREPGDDPSDLLPEYQCHAHSCAAEPCTPPPPLVGCDALSWRSLSNDNTPLLPAPPPPGTVELAELWIAGPQVGLGYANLPELTAERFRRVRLGTLASDGGELHELCFRTGDAVRRTWGAGGRCVVEVSGRRDAQVKVNGQRVELGDVEAALASSELVVAVACTVTEHGEYTDRTGGEGVAGMEGGEGGTDGAWEEADADAKGGDGDGGQGRRSVLTAHVVLEPHESCVDAAVQTALELHAAITLPPHMVRVRSNPCPALALSLTLYPVPCTLYPVPCTLYPVPCTLYPVPCTLYPVPCTLYPVPCTLCPKP